MWLVRFWIWNFWHRYHGLLLVNRKTGHIMCGGCGKVFKP